MATSDLTRISIHRGPDAPPLPQKDTEYLERNYTAVLVFQHKDADLERTIRNKSTYKHCSRKTDWDCKMAEYKESRIPNRIIKTESNKKDWFDISKSNSRLYQTLPERERIAIDEHYKQGLERLRQIQKSEIDEKLIEAGIKYRDQDGKVVYCPQEVVLFDLSTHTTTKLDLGKEECYKCEQLQDGNILFAMKDDFMIIFKVWNFKTKILSVWYTALLTVSYRYQVHPVKGFVFFDERGLVWMKDKDDTQLLIPSADPRTHILNICGPYIILGREVYNLEGKKVCDLDMRISEVETIKFVYYGNNQAVTCTSMGMRRYDLTTGKYVNVTNSPICYYLQRENRLIFFRGMNIELILNSKDTFKFKPLNFGKECGVNIDVALIYTPPTQPSLSINYLLGTSTTTYKPLPPPAGNHKSTPAIIIDCSEYQYSPLRDGRLIMGHDRYLQVFDTNDKTECYQHHFNRKIMSICQFENIGEDERIGNIIMGSTQCLPRVIAVLVAQFHL